MNIFISKKEKDTESALVKLFKELAKDIAAHEKGGTISQSINAYGLLVDINVKWGEAIVDEDEIDD